MIVAVSGTHCCGKTTLIDQFLLAHPDFTHEPEPYAALQEDYGEVFAAEPSADDFHRQLEFSLARLRDHSRSQRVIFERSPVDFLAYLLALRDLQRNEEASELIETALGLVKGAIELLDLIVFLPLDDMPANIVSDSEDPELRIAVDDRLADIFSGDDFDVFRENSPVVMEVRGSTAERLRKMESAMEALREGRGPGQILNQRLLKGAGD